MKPKISIYFLLFAALFLACEKDDDSDVPADTFEFSYDFSAGAEGWIGDFADYPEGEEESYELQFSHTTLPEPLDETNGALLLSGTNHSDDLFMFIKKEITGLSPDTEYSLSFNVEFASNVPDDQVGIGGSPGESVFIKAGATPVEPVKELDDMGYYRMNIDKNNQAQDGEDMIVIGDFSNETDENVYTLKTVTNNIPFTATSSSEGSMWIIIGTESGFEGKTSIYYNEIEVTLH